VSVAIAAGRNFPHQLAIVAPARARNEGHRREATVDRRRKAIALTEQERLGA
jgi:hypothetical protein